MIKIPRLSVGEHWQKYQYSSHRFHGEIRREFRILDYVRPRTKDRRNCWAQCPSCARANTDKSQDNLAIQIADPRFYKCWAGCTKEDTRSTPAQQALCLKPEEAAWRPSSRVVPASPFPRPCAIVRAMPSTLALPAATLRALKKRGIYCQSSLTLEFQQLARRYVLRGVESGGAVVDMGRYCAYLSKEGGAVELTQIPFSGN